MFQFIRGKIGDSKYNKRPGTGEDDSKKYFKGSRDNNEAASARASTVSSSLVSSAPPTSSSSFRHRRNRIPQASVVAKEVKDDDRRRSSAGHRSILPLCRRLEVACQQVCQHQRCSSGGLFSRMSIIVLCASFLVWVGLSPQKVEPIFQQKTPVELTFRDRVALQMKTHHEDLAGAGKRKKKRKQKQEVDDDLPPGCVRSDWQTFNLPNCNDLHEIDLSSIKERRKIKHGGKEKRLGYISSGVWRDVWAVNPREILGESAVLKMMKARYHIDEKKFFRHRRDALAMERLTSSHYVVDIYGYCGNSVLTEHIEATFEEIVYFDDCPEGIDCPNRETEEGRLRLALDAARGLKAAHEVPGGPIVHSDIDQGQFLVRDNGDVVLNDFNRCRFMAHKESGELCPFRITSVPGKRVAPEQHKSQGLDAKSDVYTLAHIFYGIFTGREPWEHVSRRETIAQVKNGTKPHISDRYRRPGTTDRALAELTYRAYELDPHDRISSSEIVAELEHLLAKFQTGA